MPKCCFVIMPFGIKKDLDGSTTVNYDKVYKQLIKPAVQGLGVDCIRCDEIPNPGLIHAQMIEKIHTADIAVVDISTLNPNVFYELGVRQALRPAITVLIQKKGTRRPFNIEGLKTIDYDPENLKPAQQKIASSIAAGNGNSVDSLVHSVLKLKITTEPRLLKQCDTYPYLLLKDRRKGLYITTGDIMDVKGVDVWVNSENTNMQMARFYDKSVSSVIRFNGAERNKANKIVKDTSADELQALVGEERHQTFEDATVMVTGAGSLTQSNGAQRVFHVAAVKGAVGKGYRPIDDIDRCVTNALRRVDTEFRDAGYRSILFPLLGTGTARSFDGLERCIEPLFDAAIAYLRQNPNSPVQRVHFQAWSHEELAACRDVLDRKSELKAGAAFVGAVPKRRS